MNPADLEKLTWVQLQKVLYDAWKQYDTPATKPAGRDAILAVYDEYKRRGVEKVVVPELR